MTEPQFTTEELISEEWKAIESFEGLYEVSSLGRVKSLQFRNGVITKARVLIMRPNIKSQVYPQISLRKDGKMFTKKIHRLVAAAFLEAPESCLYLQVNHRDLDKTNNRVANLEWTTPKENTRHAVNSPAWPKGSRHWKARCPDINPKGSRCSWATITETDAANIKQMIVDGLRPKEIQKRSQVSRHVVYAIQIDKQWRHVPWPPPTSKT